MTHGVGSIDVAALKAALHDGAEIALLDAREEVPFDARHLLMASCVPLGRVEVLVDALIPRRNCRVVWCDDGEGLAQRAAARMVELGYTGVAVLEGGVSAWEAAGHPVYSGMHVPSKAFAEVVEHEAHTPWIPVEELRSLIDNQADMVLLDSRSYEEYHGNSIPGAISVPGAELAYRFADLVPSPQTLVVVNCGGRTRSIIGAQALINAGVPNKVVSLKNGTQDWHLAGYEIVVGAQRQGPAVSQAGLAAALAAAERVAERFDIRRVDATELAAWRAEANTRSLFVLDVRTPEEYAAGHLPGARSAPGGQLVQETDRYLGVWGARVVLVDDNGVRATMTASWLIQMGWTDVAILTFDVDAADLVTGPYQPRVLYSDSGGTLRNTALIEAPALQDLVEAGQAEVVDLAYSRAFAEAHIPGAWFGLRSRLDAALADVPAAEALVFTCPDGAMASLAAAEHTDNPRFGKVLALRGGTGAWRAAGLSTEAGNARMLDAPDDIRLKAREQPGGMEAAMRAYLSWEIDLVNQMARDTDHRFRTEVIAAQGLNG